jgi:hypothetical protein
MKFKDLPKLGEKLDGGIFAGLTTRKDGTHHAVVLLPGEGRDLNWSDAKAWASAQGGELPSRPVAALLFANVKGQLRPAGHYWTSDEDEAYYAWYYDFACGYQDNFHKSYKCSAVAVRLIALED